MGRGVCLAGVVLSTLLNNGRSFFLSGLLVPTLQFPVPVAGPFMPITYAKNVWLRKYSTAS